MFTILYKTKRKGTYAGFGVCIKATVLKLFYDKELYQCSHMSRRQPCQRHILALFLVFQHFTNVCRKQSRPDNANYITSILQ